MATEASSCDVNSSADIQSTVTDHETVEPVIEPTIATEASSDDANSTAGIHSTVTDHETLESLRNQTRHKDVVVRADFLKVYQVDTKANHFACDVIIEGRWLEPTLKGKTESQLLALEETYQNIWDPSLLLLNLDGQPAADEIWYEIEMSPSDVPVIIYKRKVTKGIFFVKLQLRQFPFDIQELPVCVMSELSAEELSLVVSGDGIISPRSSICLQKFRDKDTFDLFRNVTTKEKKHFKSGECAAESTDTKKSRHHRFNKARRYKLRKSEVVISCFVSRNFKYWLYNTYILLVVLGVMSFAPFAFKSNQTNDRMGLTLELFLTCVATKMSLGPELPPITYLTFLDFYLFGVFGIIALQALQFAVASKWVKMNEDGKRVTEDMDAYGLRIMGGIVVIFNICYLLLVAIARRRRINTDQLEMLKTAKKKRE